MVGLAEQVEKRVAALFWKTRFFDEHPDANVVCDRDGVLIGVRAGFDCRQADPAWFADCRIDEVCIAEDYVKPRPQQPVVSNGRSIPMLDPKIVELNRRFCEDECDDFNDTRSVNTPVCDVMDDSNKRCPICLGEAQRGHRKCPNDYLVDPESLLKGKASPGFPEENARLELSI